MNECVLDASALLACLNDEPGGDEVFTLTQERRCLVSAVNWSETLARLIDWGMSAQEAHEAAKSLTVEIIAFDEALARGCAELRSLTRAKGLSIGDRACLALARKEGAPVYTADRPWLELAAPLSLDIRCIRPQTA